MSGRRAVRRGFSLAEMLVALLISSMLLTATLSALDASFKSYKVTTEGASTHVVTRLVVHRLASLIRTGENFGPYPVNPILNPTIESTSIQFHMVPDPSDPDTEEVWTIERVEVAGPTGPYELRATIKRYEDGSLSQTTERTLIRRVQDVLFTMEYAVGPRLERATIDLTVQPDDVQADTVGGDLEAPALRMVTSVAPRRLE